MKIHPTKGLIALVCFLAFSTSSANMLPVMSAFGRFCCADFGSPYPRITFTPRLLLGFLCFTRFLLFFNFFRRSMWAVPILGRETGLDATCLASGTFSAKLEELLEQLLLLFGEESLDTLAVFSIFSQSGDEEGFVGAPTLNMNELW